MRKLDYHWTDNKDWYYQKDNGVFVVRDDAPEEAKKSYEHYLEQSREAAKRNCMD